MKQLLAKEIKLTASPLSFIFIAFSLMTLIPGYPILIGAFFVCFGLFQTFQKSREENDIVYSVMLPIKKKDIVTSKYIFVCLIQVVGLICIALLSVVRLLALNKIAPYSNNQMLNANLVFIGLVLIVFAIFNVFFVGGYFKTAYKIGIPFLVFATLSFLTVIIGEIIWRLPNLSVLNLDYHYTHFIVFTIGILCFVIGTFASLKKSQQRFEKIDL